MNTKRDDMEIKELEQIAKVTRRDILDMVMKAKEGHIASAFSCVEILCALYFKVMRIDPAHPQWEDRDRFILSKGHGCLALYAVLARMGFLDRQILETFGEKDSILGVHPDMEKVPGIEISTGSLGHGLSIGVGMSLASQKDGKKWRVFVLLGDGECQEGSVWEAAMFAPKYRLENLIAIVDFNGLQAIGKTKDIVPLNNFAKKWESFGWYVKEVDGHNYNQLLEALDFVPFREGLPSLLIAHTVKGKGVSFMENKIMWHARATSEEEYKQAVLEIERGIEWRS